MKSLFDPRYVTELHARLDALDPTTPPVWGKMSPSQALAHCASAMENAVGAQKPPRMFIGRVFGPFVRRIVVRDDEPIRKNSPTSPELVITDQRDFERERARLHALIDRFARGGAAACTTHPHTFFGPMKPEEWAILMYKHNDHHLRQFGA